MSRLRLALSVLPLVALISACCFMGTPPPPASGSGGGTHATPPPAPTPGHTCHLSIGVTFEGSKPNGSPWDVGGGAPDPFVVVRQDGAELGRTDRVQDSRNAHWILDVACDHSRPIEIEVLDRDLSLDDHAADFVIQPEDDFADPWSDSVTSQITVTRS